MTPVDKDFIPYQDARSVSIERGAMKPCCLAAVQAERDKVNTLREALEAIAKSPCTIGCASYAKKALATEGPQ